MTDTLAKKLGEYTKNAALIDALVAFASRAPQEHERAKAWYKPFKKLVEAAGELHTAGYTGIAADQLHDFMREELIQCNRVHTQAHFRRYIVAHVALAMCDHGIKPTTGTKSTLELLSIEMLEACDEPAGGVHRLAMRTVQAIKESRPPG